MAGHRIVLYASGDCPQCRAARNALRACGHPFEERDPHESRERLKELTLLAAVAYVPTILVNGQVLVGFDASRLEEMLLEPSAESDSAGDGGTDDVAGDSQLPVRTAPTSSGHDDSSERNED